MPSKKTKTKEETKPEKGEERPIVLIKGFVKLGDAADDMILIGETENGKASLISKRDANRYDLGKPGYGGAYFPTNNTVPLYDGQPCHKYMLNAHTGECIWALNHSSAGWIVVAHDYSE